MDAGNGKALLPKEQGRNGAVHAAAHGKLEVTPRAAVNSREALSLAYTPGVAQPCLEIQKDPDKSYALTRRWNTVAVVTDGTAVLGLGDIGPEAGMPVMCPGDGVIVIAEASRGVSNLTDIFADKEAQK